MKKEKVNVDITLERRGALFLSRLYWKGFEPVKSTIRIIAGKINYVSEGLYPGSQEEIEMEIEAIKKEIGPVEFPIEADCNQAQSERFKKQLEQKGFHVLEQTGSFSDYKKYTVKFDGGMEEAVATLDDINFSKDVFGL